MAKILFIGDIVGRPGRNAVKRIVPKLREKESFDLVIANGENAAGGSGITGAIVDELHKAGVDGITLGDHVWDQRGWPEEIHRYDCVCRPANLPSMTPGQPFLILETSSGFRLGVFTLLGSQFMKIEADNPFGSVDIWIEKIKQAGCDAIFLEMHGETTSEKVAMGWKMDGSVAAVLGTHTHIPTADGRILPGGTAYQTDVGMTGPFESVIGREVEPILARFLDGMPRRFKVATGDVRLCGARFSVEPETGRCSHFERLELWPEDF